MGAGLRAIQSNARSYTNRSRRDNRASQKTREARADAGSASGVSAAEPVPVPAQVPLPVGTEFGTAFGGRRAEQPGQSNLGGEIGGQSSTSLMPPPPVMLLRPSGPAPAIRLPPMAITPPVGFQPRRSSGRSRGPSFPTSLAPEPPPARTDRGGHGGTRRGPG
jgi:hypothetical protein